MRPYLSILLRFSAGLFAITEPTSADVFVYEADVLPTNSGWQIEQNYCDTQEWISDGLFIQEVKFCPGSNPPAGQQSSYIRSLDDYLGAPTFFLEFRMETTGIQSEIPYSAPATFAAGSFGPTRYNFIISRDLVNFIRDNRLPIVWADIEPDVPHVYRLELYGTSTYRLFIDGVVVDEGIPEGPYPSSTPSVSFRAKSKFVDSVATWDYFRWGDIPLDGSGDFDTDGDIDLFDVYYFVECLDNSGPLAGAGPGCRWADIDGDTDTDLRDFSKLQNNYTAAP